MSLCGESETSRIFRRIIEKHKKRLTPQETEQLVKKGKKGNKQANDLLIKSNLGLIFWVIKKYFQGYKCPQEDLLVYGVFGLIEAIKRFDPQKGSFSNYAVWWIRLVISREAKQSESLIKLPENVVVEKERIKSLNADGKLIKKEDIANYLGVSMEKVETLEKTLLFSVVSLSKPLISGDSNGTGGVVEDFIPSPHLSIEKMVFYREILHFLREKLPPKEYNLLRSRFCLDKKKWLSLEKMGKRRGISKNASSVRVMKVMGKAKKILMRAGVNSAHF